MRFCTALTLWLGFETRVRRNISVVPTTRIDNFFYWILISFFPTLPLRIMVRFVVPIPNHNVRSIIGKDFFLSNYSIDYLSIANNSFNWMKCLKMEKSCTLLSQWKKNKYPIIFLQLLCCYVESQQTMKINMRLMTTILLFKMHFLNRFFRVNLVIYQPFKT